VPPIYPPELVPSSTDLSAPPFRLVRHVLRDFDGDIKRKLRCHDGEEVAALERLSDSALRGGVWLLIKRRAALALLAVVGMRIDAMCRLRVSDYRRDHRFGDGVGTVGPALLLRPGKTLHPSLERWKGMTPKEAEIIEVLIHGGPARARRLRAREAPSSRGPGR
jgi:integrase